MSLKKLYNCNPEFFVFSRKSSYFSHLVKNYEFMIIFCYFVLFRNWKLVTSRRSQSNFFDCRIGRFHYLRVAMVWIQLSSCFGIIK